MSTTMKGMAALVEAMKAAGLRDAFKIMIGGGPVSAAFAQKIGADACGANAAEAVQIADDWERARSCRPT
jgi:methanogenic corrinoid protein MtbC1